MEYVHVKVKTKLLTVLFLIAISSCEVVKASLDHGRLRRDTSTVSTSTVPAEPTSSSLAPATVATPASTNNTTNANKTAIATTALVTQTPLLGYNGTGQRHIINTSDSVPKVSDPILPNVDDTDDVFRETLETIKAEHNLTNVTEDNHNFYTSTFIGNVSYFNDYWANITRHKADVHEILSNSHRRATTIELSFDFPFYGHNVRNITVATGGFIYTGDHVHNWLAATQYIAPLMGNFDTTLTNESIVKMYDDGEKFTVFWENVTLQEDTTKTFTFAATLYKNGNIVFAYKSVPIPVQSINDSQHPVKVGISDAYLNDKILFYVRRKTIYEYHRVSFRNYEIANSTILMLTALPTCLQYNTCDSCVNHDTGFNCMWCPSIGKCSSGTDRNKQDWSLRHCDITHVSNASFCPAPANVDVQHTETNNTAYVTDMQTNTYHDAVVKTVNTDEVHKKKVSPEAVSVKEARVGHSPVGGVVAALFVVTLVCCLAGWLVYAFKNPHTRSGQFLIKYRPSQWSWRRGEARYTAATIHM